MPTPREIELSLSELALENVGEAIRSLRRDLKMTMQQLALKAGIDQGNLSRIENGKTKPTLETLSRISVAFDIAPHLFLGALSRFANRAWVEKVDDAELSAKDSALEALEALNELTAEPGDIDPRYGLYTFIKVNRDVPLANWEAGDILLVSPVDAAISKDLMIFRKDGTLVAARVQTLQFPAGWKGGNLIINAQIIAPTEKVYYIGEDAEAIGVVVELRRRFRVHSTSAKDD